jgi:hypothetical protein
MLYDIIYDELCGRAREISLELERTLRHVLVVDVLLQACETNSMTEEA